jgi:hypothetical protein
MADKQIPLVKMTELERAKMEERLVETVLSKRHVEIEKAAVVGDFNESIKAMESEIFDLAKHLKDDLDAPEPAKKKTT